MAERKVQKAVAAKAGADLRVTAAAFVASVSSVGEVPAGPAEFAMCGRSNVGKSSLINSLTNQYQLARVSKTPGRTQRVNLFDLTLSSGDKIRLVDLPGFGHASAPGQVTATFSPMIQKYLLDQPLMRAVVLLLDARRDRDDDAIGFAHWLRENGIEVVVIATKIDEIPKTRRFGVQARLQNEYQLAKPPFAVSTLEKVGIDDVLRLIRRLARQPIPQHLT